MPFIFLILMLLYQQVSDLGFKFTDEQLGINKKLNISVVTYKTPRAEIERLVRVAASSDVINKLFIIENGDHPIQGIEWHPKVNLVHRPDNPGYGTGHNIGLSRSLHEEIPFHLVVNADVEIMGDVVEALVELCSIQLRWA